MVGWVVVLSDLHCAGLLYLYLGPVRCAAFTERPLRRAGVAPEPSVATAYLRTGTAGNNHFTRSSKYKLGSTFTKAPLVRGVSDCLTFYLEQHQVNF